MPTPHPSDQPTTQPTSTGSGARSLDPDDYRYEYGCWVTRRQPCGCIQHLTVDDDPEVVAEFLEEAKAAGHSPEHMKYRDVYAENTLFNCTHRSDA